MKGSVTRPTGIMTERESIDAFADGTRKCASAAKELAKICEDPEWATVATTFECMRENGITLSRMKSMSRIETLQALNLKSKPFKGT